MHRSIQYIVDVTIEPMDESDLPKEARSGWDDQTKLENIDGLRDVVEYALENAQEAFGGSMTFVTITEVAARENATDPIAMTAKEMVEIARLRGREGDDKVEYTRNCAGDLYEDARAGRVAMTNDEIEEYIELCWQQFGYDPTIRDR